jgi:hypothetical protein
MHFVNGKNKKKSITVRSWAGNLMGEGKLRSKNIGEVRCEDVDLDKLF